MKGVNRHEHFTAGQSNGVRQVMGVNRHEHDERLGKYTPAASMRRDARLMKRLNVNAVRTRPAPAGPRLASGALSESFGFSASCFVARSGLMADGV